MEHKGTFKENWIQKLKPMIPGGNDPRVDISHITNLVKNEAARMLYIIAANHEKGGPMPRFENDHEARQYLDHHDMFKGSANIERISNTLKPLNAAYDKLVDLRHQEDWASSKDHRKILFYRTATTIMIAAVVLSTGFLAKTWDIPLPMLRGLPGAP